MKEECINLNKAIINELWSNYEMWSTTRHVFFHILNTIFVISIHTEYLIADYIQVKDRSLNTDSKVTNDSVVYITQNIYSVSSSWILLSPKRLSLFQTLS